MNNQRSPASGEFDPATASKWFLAYGHAGWLGLRYSAHGDDWVELELPWREDLLGEPDRPVLASGPVFSLMDMASGMAIWRASKGFRAVATLDLRVDYQRASRERSAVWGRVECYRMTRSAAFVRGVAHDGAVDDPVATMAGVFMTLASDPRSTIVTGAAAARDAASEAGTGDA